MPRAISYATTEWGGISQPIVPVRKDGSVVGLWPQVCSILEVELLIDYAGLPSDTRDKVAGDLSAPVTDPKHFHQRMEPGIQSIVAVAPSSLDRRGILTASPEDGLLLRR
jgi:hypothetical protein